MGNAEALGMHTRTKHPETLPAKNESNLFWRKWKISIMGAVLLLGIVLVLGSGLFSSGSPDPDGSGITFPTPNVHWHASVNASVCGETFIMPLAPIRDHLLHTHEDRLIHVEGIASSPDQITLGRFFQLVGVTFTSQTFNGTSVEDICPNGEAAEMVFLVNGQPSDEYENRVVRDEDVYTIHLE